QLIPHPFELGAVETQARPARRESLTDAVLGELGRQRQHEELQVARGLQERVILTGSQQQAVAGGHLDHTCPYTHPCLASKHEVELWFAVEVARPPVRG